MTPERANELHDKLRLTAQVVAMSTLLDSILIRHSPREYWINNIAQCEYCAELCHSHSGLGCDSPDAPWPCLDVVDVANHLSIDLTP